MGKVNFQNNANVFNIYYEEKGFDGNRFRIILDKDFTIIAKFDDTEIRDKEIKAKHNKYNDEKLKFIEKLASGIMWWE